MVRFWQSSKFPWLLTAVLCLICLVFLGVGWWRSTGSGAQVQVPMFYDAHYLFPRPWTQAQAAPGVPAPYPVSFYGPNRLTQPFVSGADELRMVQVWLAGAADTAVEVTLRTDTGATYTATLPLRHGSAGGRYALAIPPVAEAEGHTFWLTLAAPWATESRPVITRAIGGDRLGGALHVNEFPRPGNLQLYTYVGGTAVADALLEQLLPDLFRLRLQQYKVWKGEIFAGLLGLLLLLTGLFWVLARPAAWASRGRPTGWLLAGLLAGFLVWQLAGGRVRLPGAAAAEMVPCPASCPGVRGVGGNIRIVNDMILTLWTSKRTPEERLFAAEYDRGSGLPALRVPPDSEVAYALAVPRNGRFRTTAVVGGGGRVRFAIWFNDLLLAEEWITAARPYHHAFDIDLSALAGQGGELRLVTEADMSSDQATAAWLQPQLLTRTDWLLESLPPQANLAGHRLGEDVELVGYTVHGGENEADPWRITLYWRALRPLTQNATVFVHLLDESGELIAQDDGQPVQNSYPLTVWPVGVIIADEHRISAPNPASLAVGLYDPADFSRWPVSNPDGSPHPDGRVWLPLGGE